MKNVKRIIAAMIVMAIVAASFSACKEPDYMPKPKPTQEAAGTTPDASSGEPTPIPIENPYRGDGSQYVYCMEDERDREREEDIVFFADHLLDELHGHPKFANINCLISTYNTIKYPDTERVNVYDEELRNEFIRRINMLILSIPEKSDVDILLGLNEAAAILNDSNTVANFVSGSPEVFLFKAMPIFTDSGYECYITSAAKEYEQCLMCRLDAINGVNIHEVIERMGGIFGHSSETELVHDQLGSRYSLVSMFMYRDCLSYLGIIEEGNTATFTFTDGNGETFDIEAEAMPFDGAMEHEIVRYSSGTEAEKSDIGTELILSNADKDLWYELLSDGKVLYMHIDYSYYTQQVDNFLNEMKAAATVVADAKKIIIDCRTVNGANIDAMPSLVRILNEIDAEKYVLIDEGSNSGAAILAAFVKRFVDGAEIVGSPSSGAASFFRTTGFELPNLGTRCWVTMSSGFDCWPGYEYEVLMPDTTVYQSVEDYLNGVDSLLKYLLD
ncbi:MAG: hypothetical protein J1E60_05660 [Christensenellaceae bacterium]|nr:hypothetical protein [Christensenellaceae bacterium]